MLKTKDNRMIFLMALMVVTIFMFRYNFTVVNVFGSSMNPTYENGQYLLAVNHVKTINRYDVVTFANENTQHSAYIKRVIGLPGETIQITTDGILINGKLCTEPTSYDTMKEYGIAADVIALGDDEYFVLGDNRNNSEDSRFIGLVKKNDISCVIANK